MRAKGLMAGLAAAVAVTASAAPFDPRQHKSGFAGAPSEILVLGTPHLSGLPKTFEPAHLGPLLDRLAAWRPRIVAVEGLSGSQCEYLVRYKALYPGVADDYCWDPAPAARATGLDVPAATAEAERLLAAWPAAPAPAQRRHLAAVFMASGDRASALVQWLRLPAAERHPGDGIDAEMAAMLDAAPAKRNENSLIAAVLAARLGLERVHPVDDHSADTVVASLGDPYAAALDRIWSKAAGGRLTRNAAEAAKLGSGEGTLALYRYYNAPDQAEIAFDSDFGAALKDRAPELYGRRYVGWWETRNLRMVANIRAAAAADPGARVLAIVGASHKGYYEAYLGMMHDVRIADAEAVLR